VSRERDLAGGLGSTPPLAKADKKAVKEADKQTARELKKTLAEEKKQQA
jgi:hypothetical protein